MATTETTTAHSNQATTYSVLVVFTVDPRRDEHLQDPQAIRDEATSWLHSLDATVHRALFARRTDALGLSHGVCGSSSALGVGPSTDTSAMRAHEHDPSGLPPRR